MVDVCLLYVSKSSLDPSSADAEVEKIVRVSLSRNASLQISGALLFTGGYFAQCLEGPAGNVTDLMDKIRRDPRHHDVKILALVDIDSRHFDKWTMAYDGPSHFIERQVSRFFGMRERDLDREAKQLIRMMKEFQKDT